MSGEKCATASLETRARAALERAARTMGRLQAAFDRAERGVAEAQATLEALGDDAQRCLPDRHGAFVRAARSVEADLAALRATLEEIARSGEVAGSLRDRANRFAEALADSASVMEQVEALDAAGAALRAQAVAIAEALPAAVDTARRAEVRQEALRLGVSGVQADLRARLSPERFGSLAWVRDDALALDAALTRALGAEIEPADVDAARRRLAALIDRAAKAAHEDLERWEIAGRLDAAFRAAGFSRTTPMSAPAAVGRDPIRMNHEVSGERYTVVYTSIPEDRSLQLDMRGQGGSRSLTLTSDRHCDTNIERLVREAAELGLAITDVMWHDPDGGGWVAMTSSGAVRETEHTGQAIKTLEKPS